MGHYRNWSRWLFYLATLRFALRIALAVVGLSDEKPPQ